MKILGSFRSIVVDVICFLYILLFVYAAVSKIVDYQNFQIQVAQSPLLTAYAGFVAWAVIVSEIVISILLSLHRTRKTGLFLAFALMLLFTIYIYIILNYSPFVPCSCGGILENMSWMEHMYFNIGFTVLAVIGLYFLIPRNNQNKFYVPVRLLLIFILSGLLMAGLFLSSEDIVAHRNNFTRRFPPFPAKRINSLDLKYNSFYFAGESNGEIYLATNSAPALITVLDTTLRVKPSIHISIKDTLFKFNNVQLRVRPPYFYIFDGTVPCIYKGNLNDRQAILQSKNIPGFTKAEIVDSNSIIIRTLSSTRQHLLATVNLINVHDRKDNPLLLEKQIDGIFDTDGTMQYDVKQKKFIYLYYYRNQYIVADDKLNLIYRGNTIDTTSKAKIKIEYVQDKKQRKFSAPPLMVNRLSTLHGNLLFVNSVLRGKYDTQTMWNNANYIDIYDINSRSYLMTLYVYKVDGEKITDMIVTDNHLFTLIGNKIVAYRFTNILKSKFTKDIPAGSRSKTENL